MVKIERTLVSGDLDVVQVSGLDFSEAWFAGVEDFNHGIIKKLTVTNLLLCPEDEILGANDLLFDDIETLKV